jgi:hypothetical protein
MSAQYDHVSVVKKSNVYFGVYVSAIRFNLEMALKKHLVLFYQQNSHLHLKRMFLNVWKLFQANVA